MTHKAAITTHILDLTRGAPADDVSVRLYQGDVLIAQGVTDADGRIVHGRVQGSLAGKLPDLLHRQSAAPQRMGSACRAEDR